MESVFLFTVCQVGAEKALKEEVARDYPDLRFAFSRPGFVTFKSLSKPLDDDFELRSVFARAYGLSLGRKVTDATDAARAESVLKEAREIAQAVGGKLRLHVFERDLYAPGEEAQDYQPGIRAGALERAVRQAAGNSAQDLFYPDCEAQVGDAVLDIVGVEENEWWVGFHRHTVAHSPVPGGRWKIILPPEAPSRAYLKLEEALRWSGAPIRSGDGAVEIGSAPGGASYALLQRGVDVVGIDPGAMDPVVLNFKGPARFYHESRSVTIVRREELPESVQWLLVDMNTGPDTAIYPVERFAIRMQDSLLGVVMTLKLNEWGFAQHIPNWLERIRKMGMARVRATQLPHNRREICVVGLTRLGLARLKNPKSLNSDK
jgi:23S rRNA (cytidine2498-2'-O)-methyltransferase